MCLQESLEGDAEVLLDPNTLSSDGTVALSTKRFSEDAEFMAYGLSSSGSDWNTVKVMRVKDRVVQSDTLSWVNYCLQFVSHECEYFARCCVEVNQIILFSAMLWR